MGKILSKYIAAMKTHSHLFEFRIKVIVDEIEEMKNNKWTLRIQKETAKTLEEIHKEHFEQNNNQRRHQRGKVRTNNGHSNNRRNNNYAHCNKYWGEVTNVTFINRKPSEIEIFITFLGKLFEAKCIHNKNGEFVRENITFLARNCDDSCQDSPKLFTKYLGKMFGLLFKQKHIPIDFSLNTFHQNYCKNNDNDEFAAKPETKKKRFSEIVLSILNCLNLSKAENVLKIVANHPLINNKSIDEGVFNEHMTLYQFISN